MHLILFFAGFFGASGVLSGALASHSLGLDAQQLESWQIATRYQMYHAVALLGLALLYDRYPVRWVKSAAWLMSGGILLFSGSIYCLILTDWHFVWPLTPLGGSLLIMSWLVMIAGAWKRS